MGCLPLIVLFALGTGIGYAVDGRHGALWGAGIGLVLGLASGAALVKLLRGARRPSSRKS
jgi:NhaP-type Na+/H+ or K+/H+ antiporter